jgi:hypothetical protein
MKKELRLDVYMKTYIDFWSCIKLWATIFVCLLNFVLAKQINYLLMVDTRSPSASIGYSCFLEKEYIFLGYHAGNLCILTERN